MTDKQKEYLKKIDSEFRAKAEQHFGGIYGSLTHLKLLGLLLIAFKLAGIISCSWLLVLIPYVLSIITSSIAAYSIVLVFAMMANINFYSKDDDGSESKLQQINE